LRTHPCPASDEIRLIVPSRVLLAVTVPPALPSIGCVVAWVPLLGTVSDIDSLSFR
jgi:hypothetical protein